MRCWGSSLQGQGGLGSTQTIGDDEPPAAAAAVDLGSGRTARAITAGDAHTCAILDDSALRCWGNNRDGRLGLGHVNTIGDDETPGSCATGRPRSRPYGDRDLRGPLAHLRDPRRRRRPLLGAQRPGAAGPRQHPHHRRRRVAVRRCRRRASSARAHGDRHRRRQRPHLRAARRRRGALLGRQRLRRAGARQHPPGGRRRGGDGRGAVDLGAAAVAVSAGDRHSCAVLVDGTVRCWGINTFGLLGMQERRTGHRRRRDARHRRTRAAGPAGRCAGRWRVARLRAAGRRRRPLLGLGNFGALGYGITGGSSHVVGDDETAGSLGPVNLLGVMAAKVADVSLSATPTTPTFVPGESLGVNVVVRTTARTRPPAWSSASVRCASTVSPCAYPETRRSPAAPGASRACGRTAPCGCGWRS